MKNTVCIGSTNKLRFTNPNQNETFSSETQKSEIMLKY